MSNTIGNTKVLGASRTEALGGLLNSLGHTTDVPSPDTPLSVEQLRRLSKKINEILGDGGDLGPISGDQSSQLLNEDGLPIVDILEQVNEKFEANTLPPSISEPDLIPLSLLPPDDRERQRRERDRILDLFEEEERLQHLQEKQDEEEERRDAIRKRRQSAKAELDRLKAARELQKKMGQALVRQAERTEESRQEERARSKPQVIPSAANKRVSFADVPVVKADERDQQTSTHRPDWGEVTPGKLRTQSRIPLVSVAEADKYPMKMHVVERRPVIPPLRDVDSDNESTSSAGHHSPRIKNDSSDEKDGSFSSDSLLLDDEPLEDGFDYDTARHHHEIALEYHKKRLAIGAEIVHTLDDDEQWGSPKGQLPLSRFRAERMTTAYDKSHGPVSTFIGQTVVPASRQNSLRHSVRLGKLENDQLVGGSSESGSEDETVREVIQMLKTGKIQNAGPDFDPSTVTVPQGSVLAESPPVETSTTAPGTKSSKFKLAHGGGVTGMTNIRNDNTEGNVKSQLVVSGVVERKAPSSNDRQRFPINKPSPRPPVPISQPAPPVIESPSFPMTVANASTFTIPLPSHTRHKSFRPAHPPSSSEEGSINQPEVSGNLPVDKPLSRFMAERKK